MGGIRLQKLLARAGVASRRGAEALIREGRVSVNGSAVQEMGVLADPRRDRIRVDGRRLPAPRRRRVLALNKPREVITTLSDPQGRRTVADLLPRRGDRLFPIGRLDYHSEGLLLLTNDGDLARAVAAPGGIAKTYHVKVRGNPSPEALRRFAHGLRLDGRRTRAARAHPLRQTAEGNAWIEVTLHEGRRNQIRRMFKMLGHPVQRLRRVRVGGVELGGLQVGAVRELTPAEIEALERTVGAVSPPAEER
ncbi:MAG: pseudouridine synthase [Acidobacteriota bacterium]